jgi:hypothetical protein
VSHAGLALLRHLADKTGLTGGLSKALATPRLLIHDRGRVMADLACAIADGSEVISDFRVLADQKELFGLVASVPTAWRTLNETAGGGPRALARITKAGQVCACASKRRAAGAPLPAILQGFRIGRRRNGPLAIPRASADVAARCPCGRPRGLSARRRRRGPKGPKEGSRRPACHGPLVASQLRAGRSAARQSAPLSCGAFRPATARRAKRALEVVCRASPHRAGGAVSARLRLMCDTVASLDTRHSPQCFGS